MKSITQRPIPIAVFAISIVCTLFLGLLIPRPQFVTNLTSDDTNSQDIVKSTYHSKIKVDFYGESLCPDCKHFVLNVLSPLFDNKLSDLFDLRYIAYGNVKGSPPDHIECQHGDIECAFNRHINCAQKFSNHNQTVWFPYIKCLALYMTKIEDNADQCATGTGFDPKALSECSANEEGADLEAQAALETKALNPKHTFVPWVVVDGIALGSDFENLNRYVCVLTPSESRPSTCDEVPPELRFIHRDE